MICSNDTALQKYLQFSRLNNFFQFLSGVDESISPQHTYNQLSAAPSVPDNVDVTRAPTIQTGYVIYV